MSAPAPVPVCVIPSSGSADVVEVFTPDAPRRPIATTSRTVPMEWIDPDLTKAEGRVRFANNGVFRIEGWGKAPYNPGFHLRDRVLTLGGHAWVRATYDVSNGWVERVGDRVRFTPSITSLRREPFETTCSNLRFGYPRGEYPQYFTHHGVRQEWRRIEKKFELYDEPNGTPIHTMDKAHNVSFYATEGDFSYVRIEENDTVLVGWVKTAVLSNPPPEHGRVSCCDEPKTRPKIRLSGSTFTPLRVKQVTELYVGAKPQGAPVGMVEAGLRVRAGPAEGGFVPIDPLGDAFSPPEGQRFWIREDALERPAESPAP